MSPRTPQESCANTRMTRKFETDAAQPGWARAGTQKIGHAWRTEEDAMAVRVLVTGAGGFIGHHLVRALVHKGYIVRGVDVKYPEYEPTAAHEFELLDLGRFDNALIAARAVDEVYHLGADMGGIGYITAFH